MNIWIKEESLRSTRWERFASVQALHGLSRLSAWWVALGIDLDGAQFPAGRYRFAVGRIKP
jgi:hypothetical protein